MCLIGVPSSTKYAKIMRQTNTFAKSESEESAPPDDLLEYIYNINAEVGFRTISLTGLEGIHIYQP